MMKKSISIVLSAVLLASLLTGCGKTVKEESIELIEPVGFASPYVEVSRRDLVSAKVISGRVVPKVEPVYFTSDQRFENYEKLPGEAVNKGDVVIMASTETIDKKIEDLQKSMDEAEEKYLENLADLKSDLYDHEAAVAYDEKILDVIYDTNPPESHPQYNQFTNLLASDTAMLEHDKESIKETEELYALDSAYNAKKLERLNSEKKDVLAISDTSGKIVSIMFMEYEQRISKGTPVAAVGDFNNLEVKTDEIALSEVKRAKEIYGIVNGERINVIYKEMTSEEKEKAAEQSVRYSTFLVEDTEGKVLPGDLVTIVVVGDFRRDVLTVPSSAIYTDSDGSYVYTFDGENNVYTPVSTGLKSGIYTEIESGLSEGEKVVSDMKVAAGNRKHKLEKGKVSTNFKENGYLYYTINESIRSKVENGTVYVDEILVKQYEKVEKGQTLARVHVVADDIEIRRQERNLLRAEEDLQKYKDENDSKDKNGKTIKKQEEYIARLVEKLEDLNSDRAKTEIVAPFSGIITSVADMKEGDILLKDSSIATLAAEENCFVVVKDETGVLSCGNIATIEYENESGQKEKTTGEVVTVTGSALPETLKQGFSLIKVDTEDLAKMSASNRNANGRWMRSMYTVTCEARTADNVVVVPKSAVKLEGGVTYVRVINENGEPEYKAFVAGGSDTQNYWVAEGLSEGTEICLE